MSILVRRKYQKCYGKNIIAVCQMLLITVTIIVRCVLNGDVRGSRGRNHFQAQLFKTSISHGGFPGFDSQDDS